MLNGENATFECQTIRTSSYDDAYWVLKFNGETLSISYPNEIQGYKNQGVVFMESFNQDYYNLTMIIPANLDFNNTEIVCATFGPMSVPVHLIVFNTFRKTMVICVSIINIITICNILYRTLSTIDTCC